ncbi:LysR substrate-binding domain-containing protein [Azospirillum brasilense]|uniref:LysR substrate-binding domain-containing protein n=1 Tax=Azospirillum brasilense TaxID=192 RepID=UPI001FFE5EF6|nr:LysR substrate-binding domain-containing protein [Azospirillum brasilense]
MAYTAPHSRMLHREPRLNEALCLITHPGSRFDGTGPVTLAGIASAELAMPNEGDLVRRLVTDAMTARGLVPNVAFSLESMQAIKDMVRRGLACAILPHSAVAEDIQAGALVIRPIVEPPLMRTLFLIRPTVTEPNAATA